jgi:hypothetical protein
MKKSLLLITLIFGFNIAFAQDLTSKKGEPYLPEEKDWSIGIDASSLVSYVNSFALNAKNSANSKALSNAQTITGKYFINAKTAYRGALTLGMHSYNARNMVADRVAATNSVAVFPAAVAMKENVWNRKNSTVGLSFGIEKRRGKTRLQGLYGGEIGLMIATSKDKFTYGNALTTNNALTIDVDTVADAMSSSIFGSANNVSQNAGSIIQGNVSTARITERNNGTTISFGIRGFMGAEYFILPKMSIGGEFGFGLGLTSVGRTKTVWQAIGKSIGTTNSDKSVNTTTVDGSKNGSVKLDTDNLNSVWGATAVIRLNLYF